MATTIYGCVNRTTGVVTFEGDACDSGDYTGCIERSGEHAGQVKVVIDDTACDDTYYGCVDRGTGKFELIIPACCCPNTALDCTLVFSGVNECDPCMEHGGDDYCWPSDLNTTFVLPANGGGGGFDCRVWNQDGWCVGQCCLPTAGNGKLGIIATYAGWDIGFGGIGFFAHGILSDASSANNELVIANCLGDGSVGGGIIPLADDMDDGTCDGKRGPGSWIAGYGGSVSISFS